MHSVDTSAILDIKWRNFEREALLASADADGKVTLYKLTEDALSKSCDVSIGDESEFLALSLDWSDKKTTNPDAKIVVSDSKGGISIVKGNSASLEIISSWSKAHDLEAWIACFDAFNDNVVYSGGDDSKLKCFDSRQEAPVFVCKEHEAGVTSVLSNATKEREVFSGSYDETICRWDVRRMKTPLSKRKLSGGIWKIKQHPVKSHVLALACMTAGFFIVDVDNDFESICAYEKPHLSLAYGVDWKPEAENDSEDVLASCSFYDNLLTIWKK